MRDPQAQRPVEQISDQDGQRHPQAWRESRNSRPKWARRAPSSCRTRSAHGKRAAG